MLLRLILARGQRSQCRWPRLSIGHGLDGHASVCCCLVVFKGMAHILKALPVTWFYMFHSRDFSVLSLTPQPPRASRPLILKSQMQQPCSFMFFCNKHVAFMFFCKHFAPLEIVAEGWVLGDSCYYICRKDTISSRCFIEVKIYIFSTRGILFNWERCVLDIGFPTVNTRTLLWKGRNKGELNN